MEEKALAVVDGAQQIIADEEAFQMVQNAAEIAPLPFPGAASPLTGMVAPSAPGMVASLPLAPVHPAMMQQPTAISNRSQSVAPSMMQGQQANMAMNGLPFGSTASNTMKQSTPTAGMMNRPMSAPASMMNQQLQMAAPSMLNPPQLGSPSMMMNRPRHGGVAMRQGAPYQENIQPQEYQYEYYYGDENQQGKQHDKHRSKILAACTKHLVDCNRNIGMYRLG